MKTLILCFILIQALTLTANATTDCSDVVLTDEGNYMASAPVTSQGGLTQQGFSSNPSCYMHAASTMALGHALLNGRNLEINPEEQYTESVRIAPEVRNTTTGRTCNALNFLRRLFPDIPQCENIDFENGSHQLKPVEFFADRLVRHFDGGSRVLPLGIEYCSGVLRHDVNYIRNRHFREGDLNYLGTEAASENFSDGCEFHSSVVVGRKSINGVCHLVIQNSFGADCKAYNTDTRSCEDGRVNVPVDQLAPNTFRLIDFTNQ